MSDESAARCSCGFGEALYRCGWCDENYCEGCIAEHTSDEAHYWDGEEPD